MTQLLVDSGLSLAEFSVLSGPLAVAVLESIKDQEPGAADAPAEA